MRWVEHVARMEEIRNTHKILIAVLQRRDHVGYRADERNLILT